MFHPNTRVLQVKTRNRVGIRLFASFVVTGQEGPNLKGCGRIRHRRLRQRLQGLRACPECQREQEAKQESGSYQSRSAASSAGVYRLGAGTSMGESLSGNLRFKLAGNGMHTRRQRTRAPNQSFQWHRPAAPATNP